MLDTAASTRVPAEFIGLARQFRTAVRAEDKAADIVLAAIKTPLRERLRRHPKLRTEQVFGTERVWRECMPDQFRLGPIIIRRERCAVGVGERRITTSWITDERWGADADREPGVSVCSLMMLAVDRKVAETWAPIATVSMHALGRWFERTGLREHDALIEALGVLVPAREAERVESAGGFWLGGVINAMDDGAGKGCRIRNVRTWLAA
jgi:hypothetical protein